MLHIVGLQKFLQLRAVPEGQQADGLGDAQSPKRLGFWRFKQAFLTVPVPLEQPHQILGPGLGVVHLPLQPPAPLPMGHHALGLGEPAALLHRVGQHHVGQLLILPVPLPDAARQLLQPLLVPAL